MVKTWEHLSFRERTLEILRALEDPVYFSSPYFLNIRDPKDPSKTGLWPMQQWLYREFYKSTDPNKPRYRELIHTGGMRQSKSFGEGYFSLYETFLYLNLDILKKNGVLEGSPVYGIVAAAKEEQAQDNVMKLMTGPLHMEDSPYFKFIGYEKHPEDNPLSISFPKNFTIKVATSKTSSEVGKTSKFVCIDEISNLEESAGPRGGEDFYRLIKKSTYTFKWDGHVFIVGTMKHPGDLGERLYLRGLRLPHVLAVKFATWEFNPEFVREDFNEEFESDPKAAMRDFGGSPEATEMVYFRNPEILNMTGPNHLVQMVDNVFPQPEAPQYVLCGDPATKKDAFGLALGHKSGRSYIIDGAFHFEPRGKVEIDPTEVSKLILNTVDHYPIRTVVFDTWDYQELLWALRQRGVIVQQHFVKREDYERCKKLMYDEHVQLPVYAHLERELKSLLDLGKKIEHPRDGSKDVADAVMNCIWYLDQIQQTIPIVVINTY